MKNLDAIDETVERFEHSAEFERTHGNLMVCQEFKQIAEWLRELKEFKEKDKPKTVHCKGDKLPFCPNCGHEFETFYERCPNCGQRLRWEE